MSRPVSLGYLTPPAGYISSERRSWVLIPNDGTPVADPEALDNWQYATDLRVEKTIGVDLTGLLDSIQLKEGDELRALLVASATNTGIQRASEPVILLDGENTFSLSLVGSECGGQLRLRVVVCSGLVQSDAPLAPRRAGSVLWTEEHKVFLEGDQTRFPTEIVSFRSHSTAPDAAAWAVEIDTSDLAAPALACVRLLLNADHAAYKRLTSAPDSAEAARTREFMRFDVARQLVAAAFAADEFGTYPYEEGSLGWVLRARLANYFGDEGGEVEALRARWCSSPSELDAQLQASFEL